MKDSRKHRRMHVVSYLKLTESDTDRAMGRIVDITRKGMRLQGREPIEPNTTRKFEMSLPPRQGSSESVVFDANVIWCNATPKTGLYDVGIQLRQTSPHVSDTIQKIVENTPFEYRRLNLHRPRPMEH
jgi:hypothetical protein